MVVVSACIYQAVIDGGLRNKVSMVKVMSHCSLCREDFAAVQRAMLLVSFVRDLRKRTQHWPPELRDVISELMQQSNVQGNIQEKESKGGHSILVWAAALIAAQTGGEAIAGLLSSTCGISRSNVVKALSRTLSL
jgi:hypothetical protein